MAESNRSMPANRWLRLLLVAALIVVVVGVLWLVLGAANSLFDLWRRLQELPGWLAAAIGVLLAAIAFGGGWLGWRLLHPRPRKFQPVQVPTRPQIEQRLDVLRDAKADVSQLQAELIELDRRRDEGEFYVAVFGEISAGKSSVIRALAPRARAEVDVLGGTTREVSLYKTDLSARELVLADVPGTREVGGALREVLARDEVLRAHVVLYVTAGDLTRDQDNELRWLLGFGKPALLVLNKGDQLRGDDAQVLERALRTRYPQLAALVVVSGGGSETIERVSAAGMPERVERQRVPQIEPLRAALSRLSAGGSAELEPARERAVLSRVGERTGEIETSTREQQAAASILRYTRRAMVGALAAVAPGSDLVIQGVLATALLRELAQTYNVSIAQIDLDGFLAQAALSVRTTASIVLAIAGNALKAFPGLGTLGGGIVHAVAYGLIFDSLGRAVAVTLRDQQRLDSEHAAQTLQRLLADASQDRLRRLAQLVMSARE
jgi:uncharacterized protein